MKLHDKRALLTTTVCAARSSIVIDKAAVLPTVNLKFNDACVQKAAEERME